MRKCLISLGFIKFRANGIFENNWNFLKHRTHTHCVDTSYGMKICHTGMKLRKLLRSVRPASREQLSGVLSQMSTNFIRYEVTC